MKTRPLAIACLTALVLAGCGESSSQRQGSQFGTPEPGPETDFNQNLLLQSLVDNALIPTYSNVVQASETALARVTAYCEGEIEQNASRDESKEQAREGWRHLMDSWQQAEMMQIGPLLDNSGSLRNRIYSWPNTSGCAVDQDVMLSRQDGYSIDSRTNSRRGLDALEYLLFNDNLNHSCTQAGTAPVGWDGLTEAERRVARCEYAVLVSEDIRSNAQVLLDAWQGDAGYGSVLRDAGLPGSAFATAHEAVNDVSDALFYLTEVTKDAKLATPLGILLNDCGVVPCAANVESPWAGHSLQNIHNNLLGFRRLLQGGDDADSAVGFDDYLLDVGDADTASRLHQDLALAMELTLAFGGTLAEALEQNPEQVRELHGQVKPVTDTLKADFINSLALELPATSAGDND